MHPSKNIWNRRRFIQSGGSFATIIAADPRRLGATGVLGVSIVVDATDIVANSAPTTWAAKQLEQALAAQHVKVTRTATLAEAPAGDLCVLVARAAGSVASDLIKKAGGKTPSAPESLAIVSSKIGTRKALLASGADVRGLVYALLEITDRVNCGTDPMAALTFVMPFVEKPANTVRSVNRCFQSEMEDKPWFNDKAMWAEYLTMLASNRFNQFNLSMGLAYDYPQPATDTYTYFTYPFFVSVNGYEEVRAGTLPDAERASNLELLRFISSECAARGLDFTLGLWNHAYVMSKNSKPTYPIFGLTAETHAPYCRDALYTLLKACPNITGLTMRVHGESGIPEGDFAFWEVVFQGITKLDRKISFNLHAKGTSQRMIDMAEATNMPVSLSPKYWAEHLGLPYQPASIRETEKPPAEPEKAGSLFELSSGARRFLRYSYGDLLKKGRKHDVYFRIWPGTQRVLLWGDPKLAAGDGRGFSMCGGLGVDLFEPLSFKGRAGSGISSAVSGRCSYADQTLAPKYDWAKFEYSYRVWGRYIYNPDADPAGCHRYWDKKLKTAGPAIAQALASASRILRIVTTSQAPSAANWTFWPEMYTNMTIVDEKLNTMYRDTPTPRVYGNVSPLDPQMFVAINESVIDLLTGKSNSRYSPLEAAHWLDTYTADTDKNLLEAKVHMRDTSSPDYRRAVLDIQIQSGLGKFFSAKIRSAALFCIYQQTGDKTVLEQAIGQYKKAREAWSILANHAKGLYMTDVTYGGIKNMRGHWLDRLPYIDADIAAMEALASSPQILSIGISEAAKQKGIREVMSPTARPATVCHHTPAAIFQAGSAQPIELQVPSGISGVRLKYRHVNQAEYYETLEMIGEGGKYQANISADYTKTDFSLQYYFELQHSPTMETMYPGLGADLTDRPYFLVEQA
ncbi:hypothetical protein BH10ACI4_BH10ACI4_18570 [soil metagenome]